MEGASLSEFLAMGRFGVFIWVSYAICFGLLIVLAVQSILSWRARRRELDALEASRDRRKAKPNQTGQEAL